MRTSNDETGLIHSQNRIKEILCRFVFFVMLHRSYITNNTKAYILHWTFPPAVLLFKFNIKKRIDIALNINRLTQRSRPTQIQKSSEN